MSSVTHEHLQLVLNAVTWHRWQIDDIIAVVACALACLRYLSTGFLSKPDPYYKLWFERPQGALSFQTVSNERNVARLLEASNKDVVIFWGSQSGTSERLAADMSRLISSTFSKTSLVVDFSEIDVESITEIHNTTPALFLLSSYGEGGPPDNAVNFLSWLSEYKGESVLQNLRFAVLGLGNSNYKYYSKFARDTIELLLQLGAEPILEAREADDALGLTEETFLSWKDLIFETLSSRFGFIERPQSYQPSFEITYGKEIVDALDFFEPQWFKRSTNVRGTANSSPVAKLPVLCCKSLVKDSSSTCLHMVLDISKYPHLRYETGDHLGVWPVNPFSEVKLLTETLGISEYDTHKSLLRTEAMANPGSEPLLEIPMTLAVLFTRHLEICHPLSRQTLKDLAGFAPSKNAAKWLSDMASGEQKYATYKALNRVSLAAILNAAAPYQTWTIPLALLIEKLPVMRPRYYSIASAASVNPQKISLTIGLIYLPLQGPQETVYGVASNNFAKICKAVANPPGAYLQGNEDSVVGSDHQLFCYVRKSNFRPPGLASQPMIMIATGTGIAPFRAFLEHRLRLNKIGQDVGPMMLFFGCKDSSTHLYRADFEKAQNELGHKFKYLTAYSRAPGKALHVQDLIRAHENEVVDMIIERRAKVYICGSTAMALSVRKVFGTCIQNSRGWSHEQVSNFETMQSRSKQWLQDTWG